jgi:hypothetical protein
MPRITPRRATFLLWLAEALFGPPDQPGPNPGEARWLCPFHDETKPSFHVWPLKPGKGKGQVFWSCWGCTTPSVRRQERGGDKYQLLWDYLAQLCGCGAGWPDRKSLLFELGQKYRAGLSPAWGRKMVGAFVARHGGRLPPLDTARLASAKRNEKSLGVTPRGGKQSSAAGGKKSSAVVEKSGALGGEKSGARPPTNLGFFSSFLLRPDDPRIECAYDYVDESGALLFQSVRLKDPKDFKQRRPVPWGDGWCWNLQGVRRVLYRLPQLRAAPAWRRVFVVEGEKDADNLATLGLVATTSPLGAGRWRPEYSEFLRGRTVVILPDNDGPGRKHAEDVSASLAGKAAAVRVVELPGLPPKGDVSDWLAAGGTKKRLLGLCVPPSTRRNGR